MRLRACQAGARAYGAVLRGLGNVPAERCIFIGDGASQEFNGARRVGFGRVVFMRGFVAQNGMRSPTELEHLAGQADLTVDRFTEIEPLLSIGFPGPRNEHSPGGRDALPGNARG